jgi:hypothetical protein
MSVKVRGLSQTFNEQCLALEDVFSGDWHKGILMNFMVGNISGGTKDRRERE